MNENQAMTLLRRQRHSFLNHLQVISGWLQLDRADRARQYLEALAARIATEADASRQFPPALGLVATSLALEAETYGVAIEWRSSGPVPVTEPQALADLQAQVTAALYAASTLPGGARCVIVVRRPDGWDVHTSSGKGET